MENVYTDELQLQVLNTCLPDLEPDHGYMRIYEANSVHVFQATRVTTVV